MSAQDRPELLTLIAEGVALGCKQEKVCEAIKSIWLQSPRVIVS